MTPKPATFRMPAEWEPHAATWIGWPVNRGDWPGKFAPIPWVYGEIARCITAGEMLRITVPSSSHRRRAARVLGRAGVPEERIDWVIRATDRGWVRDSGPIMARDARGRPVVLGFGFNAWARYADWRQDARVPAAAAKHISVPYVEVRHGGRRVILEGGSIDVNGAGTVLATEECLLDPAVQVRNPGFSAADYEGVFARYLGAAQTIWLGKGIAGDDTHGHVDDLCRFVNPTTLVLALEANAADPNYGPLQENRERLAGARLADGSRPDVVVLPMPSPVRFDGRRLPASYANFYIANAAVLVPTFNDPADRVALGILAELFPDRTVVGIHAVDLVWGLGTIHCLTQQELR